MLKCPNCGNTLCFWKKQITTKSRQVTQDGHKRIVGKEEFDNEKLCLECGKCHHTGYENEFFYDDSKLTCPKCGEKNSLIGISFDSMVEVNLDEYGEVGSFYYDEGETYRVKLGNIAEIRCVNCDYQGKYSEFERNKNK